MKCPHCFIEIKVQVEFCPGCNGPVGMPDEPQQGSGAVPAPGEESEPNVLDMDDPAAATGGIDDAVAALNENFTAKKPPAPDPDDPFAEFKPQVPVGGDAPAAEGFPTGEDFPPGEEPAAAAPPAAAGMPGHVKLLIALGAAGAAYQMGLLDPMLILVGVKADPELDKPAITATQETAEGSEEAGEEAAGPEDTPDAPDDAAVKPPETPAVPEVKPEPMKEVKAPPPEEWWFYGKVYDLLTLQRVAGVDMVFIGGREDFNVSTDDKGEFKVKIPILEYGGYDILIDRQGYHEHYLIDKKAPYRNMSSKARNQLWGKIPKQKPWQGVRGKWIRRDLVLFPAVPSN
ncbi:MAG: hypothetical protein ABIJ96_10515 [Elusimicrobiota bacterium]